jgi:hypothetical protein
MHHRHEMPGPSYGDGAARGTRNANPGTETHSCLQVFEKDDCFIESLIE